MAQIIINGIEGYAFGENNYSGGMNPVTFDPRKYSLEQIRLLPGVFINPFAKMNGCEIFTLVGTLEQFSKWYLQGIKSYASKKAVAKYGIPPFNDREAWDKIHAMEEEVQKNFIPWYDLIEEEVV